MYSRVVLTLCERDPLSVSKNYKSSPFYRKERPKIMFFFLKNGLQADFAGVFPNCAVEFVLSFSGTHKDFVKIFISSCSRGQTENLRKSLW